jgi:PAS domain S-box-containing protein
VPPLSPSPIEERGLTPSRRLSLAAACIGLGLTAGLTLLAHRFALSSAEQRLDSDFEAVGAQLEAHLGGLLQQQWPSVAQLCALDQWPAAESAARAALSTDPALTGVTLLCSDGAESGPGRGLGVLSARARLGAPRGSADDLFIGPRAEMARQLAKHGGQWLDLEPPAADPGLLRLYLSPARNQDHSGSATLLVLEFEPLRWIKAEKSQLEHLTLSAEDGASCVLLAETEKPSALAALLQPNAEATSEFRSTLGLFKLSGGRRLSLNGITALTLLLSLGGGLALTALAFGMTRTLEQRHEAVRREVRERTRALRREIAEHEATEQRLRDIVEAADENLWELDLEGRFTFLTRPIEGALARNVADLLGRSHFELMPPDQARRLRAWWQELLDEQRAFKDLEYEVRRPDGSTRWVRVSGAPVFDRDGELIGYRGMGLDITDTRLAHERLAAQSQELQLILDALPAMVYYKDADNRILRINRAVSEALQKPASAIEGRRAEELFPAADAARYLAHDREVIASGRPKLGIMERFESADGQRRYAQIDKVPLPVEVFGAPRIVSVVTDVSQRERLQQQLELALRSSGLTLFDWDCRHQRLELGSGWQRLMGPLAPPRSLEGWLANIDERDRASTQQRLQDWLAHSRPEQDPGLRLELRMRNHLKEPIWVLTILEVADRDAEGVPLRVCGVQLDIDALKRSEERLDAARGAAEAANRAKSEFLANMSHEIRTPMNAILGFADLLERGDLPAAEQRDYLATIRRNGQGLLALINDILNLSKIESGSLRLETETVDLRPELEHVQRTLAPLALQKGLDLRLELSIDCPRRLATDPARLQQILINLVGNAIKFTQSGWVCLRAVAGANQQRLVLQIEDTGIGIPLDKQTEIFQPFSQADSSTTRRFGGTGLGLAISRRLAEMLGGEITLRSAPGEGSVFSVDLPVGLDNTPAEIPALPATNFVALESLPPLQSKSPRLTSEPQPPAEPRPRPRATNRNAAPLSAQQLPAQLPQRHFAHQSGDLSTDQSGQHTGHPTERPTANSPTLSPDHPSAQQHPNQPTHPTTHTPAQPLAPQPSPAPLKGYRILVVDDGEDNRRLCRVILERAGAHVETSHDGQDALERLCDRDAPLPDLVLLDMQMPRLDGYGTAHALRQRGHSLPLIALTAHAMEGDRDRCLAAGCDDFATKPIQAKHLLALCQHWLQPSERRQSA